MCAREGQSKQFSTPALERLSAYHWPGNVRELRNVVQRAYVMAAGAVIDPEWLPAVAATAAPAAPGAAAAGRDTGAVPSVVLPIGTPMAEAERRLILATLRHFNDQRERTAAVLGVSLKTLYNRPKKYAADGEDSELPAEPGAH